MNRRINKYYSSAIHNKLSTILKYNSTINNLTMKKNISILIVLILTATTVFSQQIIDVTEQTIRLNGNKEEELYYGFAEGDKIIFNYEEINNKSLKEVEIVEYPTNSRYSDYKTKKLKTKLYL